MHFTRQLGVAAPEVGWVPAPTYILRRGAVLHLLRHRPPGRVLEVGCGSGALLYDLHRHGFAGVGVEQSPRAIDVARTLLAGASDMAVQSSLPAQDERFDYLMAFEVLEHIDDDAAALHAWAGYLRQDGVLMLSVPARMRLWGDSDVWAGHFRRYERDELRSRIEGAGFTIERLITYGWPLSRWVEPFRTAVNRRRLDSVQSQGRDPTRDKRTQTDGSGIERQAEARIYPLYSNWAGRSCFTFFNAFQRYFFERDWGTGYIVVGRKK